MIVVDGLEPCGFDRVAAHCVHEPHACLDRWDFIDVVGQDSCALRKVIQFIGGHTRG